ncbi:MAG: hypothetical protein JW902_09655 [Syntrophaceae bacterium]|nr:hypothetical protein [Syntrophaceae bacterium]
MSDILPIPENLFGLTSTSGIDPILVCDWIEVSALISNYKINMNKVSDFLVDSEVFSGKERQDQSSSFIDGVFRRLENRQNILLGSYPFKISDGHINSNGSWFKNPEYAFCTILSLIPYYRDWSRVITSYVEQGILFERLSAYCLKSILPSWNVKCVGWTRDDTKTLRDRLPMILDWINEKGGDFGRWGDEKAKDGGLDILCFRDFQDSRSGLPIILVQSASGCNWRNKLHTPHPLKWLGYLDTPFIPWKGITIPFHVCDEHFSRRSRDAEGVIFDRLRLFSAVTAFEDKKLKADLRKWLKRVIESFPEK